ncbi:MAG: DUF1499 domain-containing protein [Stappiaceae bacterium]
MYTRLPTRQSRLAEASRSVGMLSIPVLIVGVLFHRLGLIDTTSLIFVLIAVTLFGAFGVLAALVAFIEIWNKGMRGGWSAVSGLVMAGLVLLPAGLAVAGAMRYPPLSDVVTNYADPPAIVISDRLVPAPEAKLEDAQLEAYPAIQPRIYPLSTADMHSLAILTVEELGWNLVLNEPADLADEPTKFQAIAHTLIFGFADDVSVRLRPYPGGARLDIRSRSRYGQYDLGANARRILQFYSGLDAKVRKIDITYEESEDLPILESTDEEIEREEDFIPIPLTRPTS